MPHCLTSTPLHIGELQIIRAGLKGQARRPGTNIFRSQTIEEDWAFHYGGRSELQFNIGREDVFEGIELRHGVAFSFELSQTLPSIDVLIPKVRHFDDYLRANPEAFAEMRMWHQRGQGPAVRSMLPALSCPNSSRPAPSSFSANGRRATASIMKPF
jgi:hypothetical protein